MSTSGQLNNYDALIFDVYSTLIDWETGIINALGPLRLRIQSQPGSELASKWTSSQLLTAFRDLEGAVQSEHPAMIYSSVLSLVHNKLATHIGVEPDQAEDTQFGASVGSWPPFPDTIEALKVLKRHYKLVVLSNVDKVSFAGTLRTLGQKDDGEPVFDLILTAQQIGSYKPSLNNFNYALKTIRGQYGIDASKVLVTAHSLTHDHAPANALGIASVWIERSGSTMIDNAGEVERGVKFTWKFKTLGEMAREREAIGSN